MRAGKSKAIIDLAEYLYHHRGITGVVVFAPNGVHQNWVRREFVRHCSTPYKAAAYQSTARKTQWHMKAIERVSEVGNHISFLTIYSETIWRKPAIDILRGFLKGHKGNILLVVDESHDFRTPSSKRSRTAKSFAKQCKFVRIMTGTPAENSPLHVWSQFEILKPGALGFKTFGEFKANYAITKKSYGPGGREFEQVVGYKNLEDLKSRVSEWASVVTKRDAGISGVTVSTLDFAMGAKQRKVYQRLVKDCLLEETAFEGGAKMVKLQQISRGWYYDETGKANWIIRKQENEALKRLKDACVSETQDGQKVIIWAAFTEEINAISDMLQEAGIRSVMYRGGMSAQAKQNAVSQFTSNPTVKVIIGQPKSGLAKGFDLSIAKTIIWFSHIHDLIDYEQASERASSVDKDDVSVIHLECVDSIDSYVIKSLSKKRSIADDLTGKGLRHILLMEELT